MGRPSCVACMYALLHSRVRARNTYGLELCSPKAGCARPHALPIGNGGPAWPDMSHGACYGACVHTTEWDRDLLRDALREIMDRAGLTQAEVGRLAGRDRTMANRWLKGQHQPNYEAAARFAAAITEQRPDLSRLVQDFLTAAGYPPASGREDGPAAGSAEDGRASSPEQFIAALREIARETDKSIGDVLVERGLATPDELTLSEQKRGDQLVKEILGSDLPEETKNILLMDYVGSRRHEFQRAGLAERVEKK